MEGAMPQLGLSVGPSGADANSGSGATGTGDFFFKQKGPVQQLLPLIVLVGAVWLITRK